MSDGQPTARLRDYDPHYSAAEIYVAMDAMEGQNHE